MEFRKRKKSAMESLAPSSLCMGKPLAISALGLSAPPIYKDIKMANNKKEHKTEQKHITYKDTL